MNDTQVRDEMLRYVQSKLDAGYSIFMPGVFLDEMIRVEAVPASVDRKTLMGILCEILTGAGPGAFAALSEEDAASFARHARPFDGKRARFAP